MGSVYRRTVHRCQTCKPGKGKRLFTKPDRESCIAAGHEVEDKKSGNYWIFYVRNGKPYNEATEFDREKDAKALLQSREGDIVHGKAITPKIGKMKFEEAAKDLLNYFATRKPRSENLAERRIRLHLTPYFQRRRMADITKADIEAFIKHRKTTPTVLVRKARKTVMPDGSVQTTPEERKPASDAEVNRELAMLKQMFTLAIKGRKLLYRPDIDLLPEHNTRTGFFEPEQLRSVLAHLPEAIQPVIKFAAITGWRVASEILPLEWRLVDFDAGQVSLDPDKTKNNKARVFPMTDELRTVLEAQHVEHERLEKLGHICPLVFFRMVERPQLTKNDDGHRGKPMPKQITSFTKAWKSACRAAGCPGRIPHDLRRTAIREMVRSGIPERVAMQMSGHETPSVFQRYNIVSPKDLKDAAALLNTSATAATAAAAAKRRG